MIGNGRPILWFQEAGIELGGRVILEKISFQVNLGEFVYIVGRTGIGKSSLLKVIYGDYKLSSGELLVSDFLLSNIKPQDIPFLRRKMGIVFQDFQLLPDRNVYQNILFAMKSIGWKNKGRAKKRITEVLVKVGMASKIRHMPHQLSGGEQQRVAIARALINDPLLIIADEPTGNLDPAASDEIMKILKTINLAGTTVMMATHEYSIIKKYPSRVIEVIPQKIRDHLDSETFLKQPYNSYN